MHKPNPILESIADIAVAPELMCEVVDELRKREITDHDDIGDMLFAIWDIVTAAVGAQTHAERSIAVAIGFRLDALEHVLALPAFSAWSAPGVARGDFSGVHNNVLRVAATEPLLGLTPQTARSGMSARPTFNPHAFLERLQALVEAKKAPAQ